MAVAHDERDTITVTEEEDIAPFVARDESTGVAGRGESKVSALNNLVIALELYDDDDESSFAREHSREVIATQYDDDYFAHNRGWADDLPDLGEE